MGTTSLIELAKRRAASSRCRHKMGAVIASGSRVLSAQANARRNSPAIDFKNASFHAEEAALRRVRNPVGATVFVARVDASGVAMMARPCARCTRRLTEAGVVGAYYTVSANVIEYMHM
ncbi:hypothetical protein ACFCXT_30445 [Streptomyces vinaceus]|uniref:hypothetical protein n=1 Tax=Streptomyces vinaceus TaxID=1960 RepID=UPI0035D561A2